MTSPPIGKTPKRLTFAPVSSYQGGNITKAAFRGGHSDVGGGYDERGLSDITLSWMIQQANQAGASEFTMPPTLRGSNRFVRHQETELYYFYSNRSINGIPQHFSVRQLYPVKTTDEHSFWGVDLSTIEYWWQ